MAPEVIGQLQNQQDHFTDLFALGVILFYLYSGHLPFGYAHPNEDQLYKLLANQRSDLFWQAHSWNKPLDFYSKSFKSLLTAMFDPNPCLRLEVCDIVGHPWLYGPFPDPEAVRLEFTARREALQLQQMEE